MEWRFLRFAFWFWFFVLIVCLFSGGEEKVVLCYLSSSKVGKFEKSQVWRLLCPE